jgi:hypothetical protein
MRTFISLALLAPLALPVACAGGVSGPVDGDSVPQMMSSGFASARIQQQVFGFTVLDVDQVFVRFFSFYGACDLVAEDLAIQNSESGREEAEEREELYRERTPEQYWSMDVAITAKDEDDIDGEDLTPGQSDENFALSVNLCRVEGYPNVENDVLVFDQDCFRADGGELEFRFESKRYIDVFGDLELIEEDGDEAGEVDVSASASWCEPADDELEDLL